MANFTWNKPIQLGENCLVSEPEHFEKSRPNPVLYLFHGQGDTEKDWWDKSYIKLGELLKNNCTCSMLVVMFYCGNGSNIYEKSGQLIEKGDRRFFSGNEAVAKDMREDLIENKNGLHNWEWWIPQIEAFFKEVSSMWL